jgi:hypothetical protein
MPLAIAHSRGLDGLSAPEVAVEVHLAGGLPSVTLVGLPDIEVKEARDRVRAALQNSGFDFPSKRITVNLAPADLPKESGRFDLPIALGILAASGQIPQQGWPTMNLPASCRCRANCGRSAALWRWSSPPVAAGGALSCRPAARARPFWPGRCACSPPTPCSKSVLT